MARFFADRSDSHGKVPGSLFLLGEKKMDSAEIMLMQYDSETLEERPVNYLSEIISCFESDNVSWINIYGLHDMELINSLGQLFKIPPLLLEDILNTDLKPKYEESDDFSVVILKMLSEDSNENVIIAEQFTLILGTNFVITLQERVGDVFAPVRDRIRKSKGRIRGKGNDYLAYTLLDTIADNYSQLVENIGKKVEDLEDVIFLESDKNIASQIYQYKIELNFLRKSIRPVKELLDKIFKSDTSFFKTSSIKYIKSLSELIVHISDAIELYNNIVSDQLNIHNTNVNNRLNEVMKVLTIFASIFIPLTFLAGIYGMNFKYFPELEYKYSYLIFWILVIIVFGGLVLYFKKKKWF